MKKDFWRWHTKKSELDINTGTALFHEREIWWCALGKNIGFEQDGNNEFFTRPVVIVTKYNLDSCLIVPLTTKPKKGKYYFDIGDISGRSAVAILSQLRFVDRKRLVDKIIMLNKDTYSHLVATIIKVCFPKFK